VRSAKPPEGRSSILLADGGNLLLQCTVGREGHIRKSWVFKYEIGGRRHEMGLGPLHTRGLAEARAEAKRLRQLLLNRVDPLVERRKADQALIAEQAKTVTFKDCAEAYLRAHDGSWKNAKHAGQWRTTLEQFVYPKIGSMAVKDVDVDDVCRCLEPIWRKIPETASRVRGRIEAVLGFATVRKFRSGDNPARWRGHLQTLFPAKGKVREAGHHAALPYAEIPAFMAELREHKSLSALALEFCILTIARTSEVTGANWDEIDLKAKTWTVPSSRMKAGREHLVPLSSRAVAILQGFKHRHGKVFPLSNMGMLLLLRRRRSATVHGMRSAFRDWAGDRTNFPREVIEFCLAHGINDKSEGAYRRGTAVEKRRRLLSAWADYCAKPAPAETKGIVVPMHEAGRG
jgi:integrase